MNPWPHDYGFVGHSLSGPARWGRKPCPNPAGRCADCAGWRPFQLEVRTKAEPPEGGEKDVTTDR